MVKFFDINNSLCSGCNRCRRICPVNAIDIVNDCYIINYSKCVACGSCFKSCPESAIMIDIPIDKINANFSLASEAEKLSEKVESLVVENKILKESIKSSESKFLSIINKLPLAIAAVDRNCRIQFCNNRFAEGAAYAVAQADLSVRTLTGTDISQCVNAEIMQMIKNSLTHSCDIVGQNISSMAGEKYSISLYSIRRGDLCVVVIREMFDAQLVKEEIEERIRAVIDRNMSMIQNIGSLLGEEASETTKILGSVIKSL